MIELTVRRGVLLFARADYERVFGQAGAVVLLRRDADLMILPIHQAAIGGHLVKRRNRAGDRAVDALELLRGHGLDGEGDLAVHGRWDDGHGALIVTGLFR